MLKQNKYMKNLDKGKGSSYLVYLDNNCLYKTTMASNGLNGLETYCVLLSISSKNIFKTLILDIFLKLTLNILNNWRGHKTNSFLFLKK